MQPHENICDPDEAEQKLKQIIHQVVDDFAKAAGEAVVGIQNNLENEFANVGLECFASDYALQKRLRELFPSRRRLDDIEQLLRDATSHTLRTRIQHRFRELENGLRSIHRNSLAEPMATATRNFVQEMLHYASVTVGNRGEFLRHRFNLRLKTLVKAAQEGQLDSWSALSDDEQDEGGAPIFMSSRSGGTWRQQQVQAQDQQNPPLQRRQSSSSATAAAFTASGAVNAIQSPSSATTLLFNNNNSSAAATMTKKFQSGRIPTSQANQKIAKIESASTAVLDELTELRTRLDSITSTRHEEIEALKSSYEKEMAVQAAQASEREHRLRTDAADLRVRVSDMDRVLKQTGDLIQRLHAQSIRYRKELNLFVEVSRDESLRNCYPLMAKRLTHLEREDLERDKNGEIAAQDDEVLQRIGIHLFSFEGRVPSLASLAKQHDVLNAMRAALMNHEKTKEVMSENAALTKANDTLKRELIEVRNQSKRFEVDLRNDASARETKLVNDIKRLKELLNVASEKLRTSHIAVIGTNDQLTGDLILRLQEAELKNRALTTELQIARTIPSCARAPFEEINGEDNKRLGLVLRRKRSLVAADDDDDDDDDYDGHGAGQKKSSPLPLQRHSHDDDEDEEDDNAFEAKIERLFQSSRDEKSNSEQKKQQECSSRETATRTVAATSARPISASSRPTPIPPRFLESDTKKQILQQLVLSTATNKSDSGNGAKSMLPRPPSASASSSSSSTTRFRPASASATCRNANPAADTTEAARIYEHQVSTALDAPPKNSRNNGLFWQQDRNHDYATNHFAADRQFRAAVTTLMRPVSAQGGKKLKKVFIVESRT